MEHKPRGGGNGGSPRSYRIGSLGTIAFGAIIAFGLLVMGTVVGIKVGEGSLISQIKKCPDDNENANLREVKKRIVITYDDPPTRFSQLRISCDS